MLQMLLGVTMEYKFQIVNYTQSVTSGMVFTLCFYTSVQKMTDEVNYENGAAIK